MTSRTTIPRAALVRICYPVVPTRRQRKSRWEVPEDCESTGGLARVLLYRPVARAARSPFFVALCRATAPSLLRVDFPLAGLQGGDGSSESPYQGP